MLWSRLQPSKEPLKVSSGVVLLSTQLTKRLCLELSLVRNFFSTDKVFIYNIVFQNHFPANPTTGGHFDIGYYSGTLAGQASTGFSLFYSQIPCWCKSDGFFSCKITMHTVYSIFNLLLWRQCQIKWVEKFYLSVECFSLLFVSTYYKLYYTWTEMPSLPLSSSSIFQKTNQIIKNCMQKSIFVLGHSSRKPLLFA